MGKKESLFRAYQVKNDEFYTLFEDIAEEVSSYKDQLRGKRIICPCDWDESYDEEIVYSENVFVKPSNLVDLGGSVKSIDLENTSKKFEKDLGQIRCNFIRYLVSHAEDFGITSISVSGYNPQTGVGVKFQDIDYSKYDLVITNPPFSLFREFLDVIFRNNLEFLIIGPQTAITYKESFNYIAENKMWLGYHYHLTGFVLPDGSILGKSDALPRCCCWYTNLDVSYRHDRMILTREYCEEKNPKYYNFDAIDVSKTLEIPCNYEGLMGVPITFLQKYNPDQFEIIGLGKYIEKSKRFSGDKASLWIEKDGQPFKPPFERIIIRNKQPDRR